MSAARQIGWLMAAALCFHGFLLLSFIFTRSEPGKSWIDVYSLAVLLIAPLVLLYAPIRFAILQRHWLLARPLTRLPLWLFAVSPQILLVLLLVYFQLNQPLE